MGKFGIIKILITLNVLMFSIFILSQYGGLNESLKNGDEIETTIGTRSTSNSTYIVYTPSNISIINGISGLLHDQGFDTPQSWNWTPSQYITAQRLTQENITMFQHASGNFSTNSHIIIHASAKMTTH